MSEILEKKSTKKSGGNTKIEDVKKVPNTKIKNKELVTEQSEKVKKSVNTSEKVKNNEDGVRVKENKKQDIGNAVSTNKVKDSKSKKTTTKNEDIKESVTEKSITSKNVVEKKKTSKSTTSKNITEKKVAPKVVSSKNAIEKKVSPKGVSSKTVTEKETQKTTQKTTSLKVATEQKKNKKVVEDKLKQKENLPTPESKFDTVSLKEIREALQNKVNNNQKSKVVKKVLINGSFLIIMILFLVLVWLGTKYIEISFVEKILKITTIVIAISGIILLEIAYKKDNTQIALNALEIIGFGAVNLYLSYTIELYAMKLGLENITNVILYVGGAILIYYILKCIVIAVKNIKKFKKENNDIKEIIKK